MARARALQRLRDVLHELKPVGDPEGVGSAPARALRVGAAAVAADQLHAGMPGELRGEGRGFAVGERIDDRGRRDDDAVEPELGRRGAQQRRGEFGCACTFMSRSRQAADSRAAGDNRRGIVVHDRRTVPCYATAYPNARACSTICPSRLTIVTSWGGSPSSSTEAT